MRAGGSRTRRSKSAHSHALILAMENVGMKDVALVGGKNASLGEMLRELSHRHIRVPSGFIVTAEGYRLFLREAGLEPFIRKTLKKLKKHNANHFEEVGALIRRKIKNSPFPQKLEAEIRKAYRAMEERYGARIDVAVRSSATAEDMPDASFAGEHDTYLGVRGEKDILHAVRACFASLFTGRAISYRIDKGYDKDDIALSVGVQRMVRSDLGSSGVIFTLDTESGFRDVVFITSSYGLGEMIVQGKVVPDEFLVAKKMIGKAPLPIIGRRLGSKQTKLVYAPRGSSETVRAAKTPREDRRRFSITNKEVMVLAQWAKEIEEHYSKKRGKPSPMDIEWGLDGKTHELFILQARPETVQVAKDHAKIREYIRRDNGTILVKGLSVGSKIVVGKARVIKNVHDMEKLQPGEILVTEITDPDWEPVMKKAVAIVTDKGGRTSHAAIVSRELGLTAVVGTEKATRRIKTGQTITVDTTSAEGIIFDGSLRFDVRESDVRKIPKTKTKIAMNLATPDTAFEKSFLPHEGVGLAREEFIITSSVGVHPLALIHYKKLDRALRRKIDEKTHGWSDKKRFYVDNLAYGIAKIATAFYPKQVIVRFSDFKSNEYRTLLGGEHFEPIEENPMLGWRGASRYHDPKFREAFELECEALLKVREEMGLTNAIPMVPFCRTLEEGRKILITMEEAGLHPNLMPGEPASGLKTPVIVMCEIPSNVILADQFLDLFDGMSIGSNDLTQLTLGLDRDSGIVNRVADENDPAVKKLIAEVIKVCKRRKKYVGICGQGPSDHPEFAKFLVEQGIESMSLNPDSVIKTIMLVAKVEKKLRRSR